jgi:hypothetical protein
MDAAFRSAHSVVHTSAELLPRHLNRLSSSPRALKNREELPRNLTKLASLEAVHFRFEEDAAAKLYAAPPERFVQKLIKAVHAWRGEGKRKGLAFYFITGMALEQIKQCPPLLRFSR